eukprot:CAMPEP_0113944670 /NCGR_PEP_ID=MMETSP1339-20121228/35413_1 /TAXON_ID=94617 /ORGANISM="Fibrocapsa japonica" /LENGTH=234 /DNA_ID=CAMNT_0000949951 /DNA_START=20 /DNA_END=724 /DNA_ORIENTATION=+ /assembly_acc=CAM_ASM_000762
MPCFKDIFRVNSNHRVIPLAEGDANNLSIISKSIPKCKKDEYDCQNQPERANTWELDEDLEDWTQYIKPYQNESVMRKLSSSSKKLRRRPLDVAHRGWKAAVQSYTAKKLVPFGRPRVRATSIQKYSSATTHSVVYDPMYLTKATAADDLSKENYVVSGVEIINCPENLATLQKVEKYRTMKLELRLKALTERTAEVQRQLKSHICDHNLRHDLEEEEDILFLLTKEVLFKHAK